MNGNFVAGSGDGCGRSHWFLRQTNLELFPLPSRQTNLTSRRHRHKILFSSFTRQNVLNFRFHLNLITVTSFEPFKHQEDSESEARSNVRAPTIYF